MRTRVQILVTALTGLALAVTGNQVINNGQLNWNWLYLSLGLAVIVAFYGISAPPPSAPRSVDAPSPSAPRSSATGRRLRGTRRLYLRQLREAVSEMETIGVKTQGTFALSMRQVYVDLLLRPFPPHNAWRPDTYKPDPESRPLATFLGEGRVLTVLGGPGSGKTTLVRHAALSLCEQVWYRRRKRVPVMLYLRDHAASILGDDPPGLPETATAADWLKGRISGKWVEEQLDRRRCVVFLDGLDEVADEHDRKLAVAWIRSQIARYPGNDWVVTSRPHGYLSNPMPNADVLGVQQFSRRQISLFLRGWYEANERRARDKPEAAVRALAGRNADDLIARVLGLPALAELAANPLLLTMIANVHLYRGALPHSRAELYREMCDVLLHLRQDAKNLKDGTGLDGPKKEVVMQHLAAHMMRHRFRDITLDQAREIVAEPLRLVAEEGHVSPELFLAEAGKSGLFVEWERGVHGFAHLTLQEYLCAAHIRLHPANHTSVLTENVDDPWWRETSLLWAALGDATPLVEACLDSGTVRTLALAFDGMDEARLLQTETRARLNRLLTPPAGSDGERTREHRRLIAAVTASRALRRMIWLDGTTSVCAQPVTRDLYALFAEDEKAAGRHTPAQPEPTGTAPARGLWPVDVTRFLAWLDGLFDDGTHYRLPTLAELAHPGSELIPALSGNTVWAGPQPVLHRPDGVAWPFLLGEEQLSRYPSVVLSYVELALRLARATTVRTALEPSQVLAYTHAFRTVRTEDPPYPPHVRLVVALNLAQELAQDLVLGLTLSRNDVGRSLERARDLTRDLDRALDLTLALTPTLDHLQDIALVLDEVRTLSRDLAAASEQMPLDLDQALGIAKSLRDVLTRALVRALNRVEADALTTTNDLAVDLDRALTLSRARDFDPGHDRDLVRSLIRDLVIIRADTDPDPGLALARDLARSIGPYHRDLLATAATVFGCLYRCWATNPARRGSGPRWPGTSFEEFLTGLVNGIADEMARPSVDPAATLRQALAELQRAVDADALQVRRLVEHAFGLAAPILDRTAPLQPRVLTTAGVEILSAIGLLRLDDDRRTPVVPLLAQALGALIVAADPEPAPPRNDILLLVHT
ncbi:NACHT domain-containing protein [Streptosporangium sp. NPDC051023]|uniref:NACHT domain-containing protein n=1 Tax=Streptosporangium sp. NPDC051023 TaxID=3155410 RepID=UPI00344DA64C